jgi:hypothetical protein
MAFDPRKGRLIPSEVDREYSVKVAKQNLRRKSIFSLILLAALIALLVGVFFITA